jgi:hypothetical protein
MKKFLTDVLRGLLMDFVSDPVGTVYMVQYVCFSYEVTRGTIYPWVSTGNPNALHR